MGFSADSVVNTKIKPSSKELEILNDQSFLQLKASVSKKIISYLAEIEKELKIEISSCSFNFPANTLIQAGKISKGEKYRGLPYFVLDYPRLFTQKEVFALRTMIWWGNEFSCTLHIGGRQLQLLTEKHILNISRAKDLFFCIGNTPWEYHYEHSNYKKISDLTINEIKTHLAQNEFIKISRFINIQNWKMYKSFALESFARFLMLLE